MDTGRPHPLTFEAKVDDKRGNHPPSHAWSKAARKGGGIGGVKWRGAVRWRNETLRRGYWHVTLSAMQNPRDFIWRWAYWPCGECYLLDQAILLQGLVDVGWLVVVVLVIVGLFICNWDGILNRSSGINISAIIERNLELILQKVAGAHHQKR